MMKNTKVLLIGTRSDIANNRFTGQSVLFDGILEAVTTKGLKISHIDISSKYGNGTFQRIVDYFIVLSKLLSLLFVNKFSLAYLVSSQSRRGFYRDFLIVSLCRLFRIKVITHQYGANYNQMLNSMTKLELYCLRKMTDYISAVIVEGEYMKHQFSFYKGYEEKVKVIPNGLPNKCQYVNNPKEYNNHEPFVLFYLSNLIYSKGYFDVLTAIDLLINKYGLNVRCYFAGQFMRAADDPHPNISSKSHFENYIAQHNLHNYITYYPGLYGEEKKRIFNKSHAFILPTYYINEGQPVSILEAMSYGCVPIVTDYRHIPMMVNDNNGCFVQAKSPESICSTVIELIKHPEIYNKKSINAIDDYKTKYNFNIFSSKVLCVMNEVINRR